MAEAVDAVVIGAGVVGLAVARALALEGREVIVVERNALFGAETSSRNSEVIHAGIYYRPGGLRARLCVEGRERLYAYCRERGVGHLRCEKLIVATSADEIGKLKALDGVAKRNGVHDLALISGTEARGLEPDLACEAALVSPSSGIVDSHGLMLSLLGDLENAGGALALSAPATGGRVTASGVEVEVGGAEPVTLSARLVVNSAGLWADAVARSIIGLDAAFIPAPGVTEHDLADAAQLASLADETPEGRSIVVLAKQRFDMRGREMAPTHAKFVPFTAQRRMSGVDIDGVSIRKGAVESVLNFVSAQNGGSSVPSELMRRSITSRWSACR